MADYGLTDNGLVTKDLPTIIQEKEEAIVAQWGPSSNLNPESNFGQNIAIAAERELAIWELIEQIHKSTSPATATGAALDMCLALTGLVRQGATYSRVTDQAFWGDVGVLIPSGTKIKPTDTDSIYETDTDVTTTSGSDQIQLISFSEAPVSGTWLLTFKGYTTSILTATSTNTDVRNALIALPSIDDVSVSGSIVSGLYVTFSGDMVAKRINPELAATSSLVGSPDPVAIDVTISAQGIYQAITTMTAVTIGSATYASQGTLVEIVNSPGAVTTSNESSAVRGIDRESDAEAYNRRKNSIGLYGKGTVDGIRAAVLDIEGVFSCLVYENDKIATDAAGRPGKSFETYVAQTAEIGGGTPDPIVDQLVGEAILRNKGAGMQTFGSAPAIYALDSAGRTKAVYYSRPVTIDIYLDWVFTVSLTKFPIEGATTIGKAIVEYGNAIGQGIDVIVDPYLMGVLQDIPGILDVITKIGTTPFPTGEDNVIIEDGTTGPVETSVWRPENIRIQVNGSMYIYNAVLQKWV